MTRELIRLLSGAAVSRSGEKTMARHLGTFLAMVFLASAAAAQFSQQGSKLVGSGAAGYAAQGSSVAISADGNTTIVGAPLDDSGRGAAWVYTRSGGVWSQQGSKLVGSGAVGAAYQGDSVAISADGNTAIVGGYADNSNAGAAWVFTRSGGVWSQQGPKLVGTGAVGNAGQGAVAISADGNTAIVGGPNDNSSTGAAWVFTRTGGVWSQQASKLVGNGAVGAARQGTSVALSADGNSGIVGGPYDNSYAGAAWVYTRSGGVWPQQGSKLVGNGAVGTAQQGTSVATSADGNTAIVGGDYDNSFAGAAWVFRRSGAVWPQGGSKLVGTGAVGQADQGSSVTISADGNTAIVGGPSDNSQAGAAWVFTRSAGVWSQQGGKLVGTGAVGTARQGQSVAISADGTTAVVGGFADDSNAGAAWVFVASGCAAPVVLVPPQSQSVQSGQTATLSVTAGGTGPLSYQWYEGYSGDTSTAVGTNASSLTTPVLTATTSYWVRVSNACGQADSATASVSTGCIPPSITSLPQGMAIAFDQTATLTVTAAGSAPLFYQWFQGASGDISRPVWPNASSFTTPTLGSTTSYWVRVSNACGHADSATATISVRSHFTWVPVASHNSGKNNSEWRSDLGLLNPGTDTISLQITFLGSSGVVSSIAYLSPGAQSILTDVVGQLGGSGSGAIEISSDQPLKVTSRTYNQVPSDASCYPDGTQGQDYPAVVASDGLATGQSAYLAGLVENASYRCNIGLVNVGSGAATVLVELYDGAGTKLTDYTVSLTAGQWAQETQPFLNKAGQTAMNRGYAKITVQSGSGVFGFASVVDNITNDPTTITTQSVAPFIQQGSKCVGTGAVGGAAQGGSVAISADGNTAIVGGPNDNSGVGAAWVYTRSGGVWSQQGEKLIGSGAVGAAQQGTSVAISADGNTAIVGGITDNSLIGAAWVFTRSGGVWSQQGDKLIGNGAVGVAWQGSSVTISADGNTAIVGGPFDNNNAGAAWVFTRSGGVWSQQGSKLVGAGAVGRGWQGSSVTISADGNTAIVGAPQDNSSVGAAWVFTRSGGAWTQQGDKLVGTGIAGFGHAWQGASVALSADGNTALVGGPVDGANGGPGWPSNVGATWVFTRSRALWSQQGNKLVGTGAVGPSQQGASVALSADGNTAIIGGPYDGNLFLTPPSGAAWVFTRSDGVWAHQGTKLIGAGAVGSAGQGISVAISADGHTAIIGGPGDSSGDGAAWVFSAVPSNVWVPVVAHNLGLAHSQWRSDLGLLNTGTVTANAQIKFFGTAGVLSNTTYVPPGVQSVLTDVVGQLGASGQGALEILSDQPLKVTSRTYNQVPSEASCDPAGTQGQDYPVLAANDGLAAGQSAYLAGLAESASYRSNIGVVNVGSGSATVLVELFNGAGTKLTDYTVSLAAGQWAQETQPFLNKAGQTAMDRGYARITVQSGSGVFAFASVIDNLTNDPTTIAMQR